MSIHVSTTLSGVLNVASVAAQETTSTHVTVFDSRQLSLGTGFLVEKAAIMAAAGGSVDEILHTLNDQVKRIRVFAVLDTLEFLKRSGRMNRYLAGLATLLQIKPIMTMHDGKPGSERVRTQDRALKRVVEMLAAAGPLERVAMVHTHASQNGRITLYGSAPAPSGVNSHRRYHPGHWGAYRPWRRGFRGSSGFQSPSHSRSVK